MFWRVASISHTSAVEAILDKGLGSFTLEELLEEDDLIQETKGQNNRLIDFLKKPDTIEKLVIYLVEPPTPMSDAKRRFKYPYSACEVLCCEVDSVMDSLCSSSELLVHLFSIADSPRPADSLLAGYFARVVGSLLMRRGKELLAWLEGHTEVLHSLAQHLDTTSMAETLVRVVGADEQTATFLPSTSLAWLAQTDIMQLLLTKLEAENNVDTRENAAEVLAAIARSRSSPLTKVLGSPELLQALVDKAFDTPQGNTLVQALNICIALVERRRLLEGTLMRGQTGVSDEFNCNELDMQLEAEAVAGIAPYTPRLLQLLQINQAPAQELQTPYGLLRPPLGSARLTVIALLAVLLRTGSQVAEEAVINSGILKQVLHLLLQYPFNSILHHQISSILGGALDTGSDPLVAHLFADCNLLTWVSTAPSEVRPLQIPGDTRGSLERRPLRAGYLGHLTQVANKIIAIATKREVVAKFLNESTEWQAYVDGELKSRNQVENVSSWGCGRPNAVGRGGVDSDSDEQMFSSDELNVPSMSAYDSPGRGRYEDVEDDDKAQQDGINPQGYYPGLHDDEEEDEEDEHNEETFSEAALTADMEWNPFPQGPESAPMAWNASFPDTASSSTQYAQTPVDPFAGSPFAVVATRPAEEEDGADEERLAAFFGEVGNNTGTEGTGTNGVNPGTSPPNTWESLIQDVQGELDEDATVLTEPARAEEGQHLHGLPNGDVVSHPVEMQEPDEEALSDEVPSTAELEEEGPPSTGVILRKAESEDEETLVGRFMKLSVDSDRQGPAPSAVDVRPSSPNGAAGSQETDDVGGGENEFSSFNYWRRNYPVEVDADV